MTTLHYCIQNTPLSFHLISHLFTRFASHLFSRFACRPSAFCGLSLAKGLRGSAILSFLLVSNVTVAANLWPQEQNKGSSNSFNTEYHQTESPALHEGQQAPKRDSLRIVSLAPHLTEWAYSLGLGPNLVAVSDYSDYPDAAKALPRVADYQGVDMAAILAFKPDLVLAWKGGNKPQDIQKLSSLGLNVFDSAITQIDDIPSELIRLGTLTHTNLKAKTLAEAFSEKIAALKSAYSRETPKNVFYYSWSTPLMTVGPKAWPNKLLNVCGAQTVFYDSPIDYPQVSVSEVLMRQVDVIIAASNESKASLSSFWEPHSDFLDAEIITVNPDITSRFSLRLADELNRLCHGIN